MPMNETKLQDDWRKDAIAVAVRRRRRERLLLRSIPVLLLVLSIGFWLQADDPPPEVATVPSPVMQPRDEPVRMEIIESEEELLDLLAEFGPVLTEDADGGQTLLLTRFEH
ncbi:MAG: hypothetical protein AAGI48_11980 [Verrucomicrobiota bacterium]